MKDKHIFILLLPVFAAITIFAMFMAITATHGPVALTDEEVTFYEQAATNYLKREKAPHTSNTKDSIRYIEGKDKVTVMSHNLFKETVTATYENGNIITKVNAPNVNFTGCIIFHSLIATAAIGASIFSVIVIIDEFRCNKKTAKAR